VTVDGIGHHPPPGQPGRLDALKHVDAEFRFGVKGDGLRDADSASARQISTPVCGQIQLAVDEAMTQVGNVGEKNADLTVFDASGASAILRGHPGRMAAAFGKAAFIKDQDGIERLLLSTGGNQGRRRQGLAD
jgi:hypothetical protein